MKRRLLVPFAIGMLFLLVATACSKKSGSGDASSSGPKPVAKIAFVGALSGDYKLLVVSGYNAAKMAFDAANAAGDLPVTITFVPFDSQGSGDIAAPLVDQIVGDPSFVGVIGPAFSGESAATGDKLDQAGIPFVTQSASDDALAQNGWTHWFRALGNNSDMGIPAADYISKIYTATSACASSDGTPYGLGLKEVAVEQFGTLGIEVALNEDVEPAGKDYSALVTKIKDSACQAFFYGGYSPEAGLIRKQMDDAGLKDIPMVGGDGIKDDTFITTAGTAGNGTISSCVCADLSASTEPDDVKFISDYKAAYGAAPQIYGPEGYDIAQMYIAAFKAGHTDRQGITDFIRGMQAFHGLTKDYTWEADGQLAADARILFFYEVKNGAWTVLGSVPEVIPS